MRRNLFAAILGIILLIGLMYVVVLFAQTDRADATPGDPYADHRACVDNREVAGLHERLGRTELERRWEVTGLGKPYMSPIGEIVAYPWCDHAGLPYAYLGVYYSQHRRAVAVVWWDCTWPGNVCPGEEPS